MFKVSAPFSVPMELFVPTYKNESGFVTKEYPKTGEQIFGNFKTYGGTEVITSGVYAVEATGVVETWYRPDITADAKLKINGADYEILGQPENINLRNQFLKIKVRLVRSGA